MLNSSGNHKNNDPYGIDLATNNKDQAFLTHRKV